MVLNRDIIQIGVHIVAEMEESALIKVFLQFNKHVLNVPVVGKKLQIHVMNVVVKEIDKLQRKSL